MWVEGQNETGSGDPLTPSNSTPAAIVQDNVYEAQGNGYAIESYANLAPDNDDPATITAGQIYKAQNSGYAVDSIFDIVPGVPIPINFGRIIQPLGPGYISGDYGMTPTSAGVVLVRNNSQTYPPELNRYDDYIVNAVVRVAGSTARGASWFIHEGNVSVIRQDESNISVTTQIIGDFFFLTVSSSVATYYVEFRVIKLDYTTS